MRGTMLTRADRKRGLLLPFRPLLEAGFEICSRDYPFVLTRQHLEEEAGWRARLVAAVGRLVP